MELNLKNRPFNLNHTLNCGQAFRWDKIDNWWYGVVKENIIKIKQIDNKLIFFTYPKENNTKLVKNYFRLNDDLNYIIRQINKDKYINEAIRKFYGLRIIRQEPWECLISYICATNTNIPIIRNMIFNLSKKFGEKIKFGNHKFYTFPKACILAKAGLDILKKCGIGYRAEYISKASKMTNNNEIQFNRLSKINYQAVKKELLQIPGVGPKVADCICLFSLDKLDAFPVDIWVTRSILELYHKYFDSLFTKKISGKKYKSLTLAEYNKINSFGKKYFGKYAGYAQEYLFYYKRMYNSFIRS
ncbi:MAG: hypothetical protein J7J38_04000 [Candidatus Aenigmarchaeota archaeon]|nr:hypothetical protein [Candidatus Aenigmarchaeota archaeon]